MTDAEFQGLQPGQIVCSASGQRWIVTANYGGRVTAAQTADITNPAEWEVVTTVGLVNHDTEG